MTDYHKPLPLGHSHSRMRGFSTALATVAVLMTGATIGHASGHDRGHVSAYTEWGIGARPVAMGGAYSAVAEAPSTP